MVEIKYIGNHQPTGMIVDIDPKRAKAAIESGEYELVSEEKIVKKAKEVVKDDNPFRRNKE